MGIEEGKQSLLDKWKDEGLAGLAEELIRRKEDSETMKKAE